MREQRIYLDTSVIGGCFDPEFTSWSRGLMTDFRLGTYLPVVSEVVAAEIADAPEPVQRQYAEVLALEAEVFTVAEVDLLVSWNFRHIVHHEKIRLFNALNLERGYKPLQIYSPREVKHHGEDRDPGR
jgi:hypothetical protein